MLSYVNTETSSYQEIVEAIKREYQNPKEKCINEPSYSYKYFNKSASSVPVCDLPNLYKEIGIKTEGVVYDKTHLYNHMKIGLEDGGYAVHGHNGTIDSLYSLPEILAHPVAIIPNINSNCAEKTKLLAVLCAIKENGKQTYKKIVMQPYDAYDGISKSYIASKIRTYFDIDEKQFLKYLKDTQRTDEFIYFSSEKFKQISFSTDNYKDINIGDKKRKIKDETKIKYDKLLTKHAYRVDMAATQSVMQYNSPSGYFPNAMSYTPFVDAIDRLNSSTVTVRDLGEIQKTVKRTCTHVTDKYEIEKCISSVNDKIASVYINQMSIKTQESLISSFVNKIEKMPAYTQEDIDNIYSTSDYLENLLPTLSGCNIKFTDSLTSNTIKEAMHFSEILKKKFTECINNAIDEKMNEYEKNIEDNQWELVTREQ